MLRTEESDGPLIEELGDKDVVVVGRRMDMVNRGEGNETRNAGIG